MYDKPSLRELEGVIVKRETKVKQFLKNKVGLDD